MSLQSTSSVGVKIENLHLRFGNSEVLRGINLDIKPGEFFAFLGPSGSGKTTLLRAIAGFGPQPDGRILIGNNNVVAQPPWKRNVGMVFQSYALWPHMSVWRNVAFGLEERRVSKAEIRQRVQEALALVGLEELAQRYPAQLSGGQQQRVALARTIVIRPQVLLLDEPLSNLDANLRVQMRREILALQRELGLTTIFVTHDQEEANTTSDRIAVMNDGVVQQVGSPLELYDRPTNRFVASFLGTVNILDGSMKAHNDGSVFTSSKGLQVPLQLQQAGDVSIVFRPQSVHVCETGVPTPAGALVLEGIVQSREFLGSSTRYAVKVSDHVVLAEQLHNRGAMQLRDQDSVRLLVAPEQVSIVNRLSK